MEKSVLFCLPLLLLCACASYMATNWEAACNKNDEQACALLATAYSEGSAGVSRDYAKAYLYANKACTAHAPIGCSVLAQIYDKGLGVPKSTAKAIHFYELACKENESLACHNLGVIYSDGEGVPKSYAKAMEFFSKACELGRGYSCYGVGALYEYGLGVKESIPRAIDFYSKGCQLKSPEACSNYQRLIGSLEEIMLSTSGNDFEYWNLHCRLS